MISLRLREKCLYKAQSLDHTLTSAALNPSQSKLLLRTLYQRSFPSAMPLEPTTLPPRFRKHAHSMCHSTSLTNSPTESFHAGGSQTPPPTATTSQVTPLREKRTQSEACNTSAQSKKWKACQRCFRELSL